MDIHVNMAPNEVPVPAGTAFEVEYVFEVYGDGMTSADEIRQIGLASLAAGDIVVDEVPVGDSPAASLAAGS